MRRNGKLVAVVPDLHVVHGNHGQVALQRLPRLAVVERHVNAELGPRVEQTFPLGVGPDDPRVLVLRYAVGYALPRLAVVIRLVEQGSVVGETVAVRGNVCRRRIVRRKAR